jgi:hypothetical protein
VQVNLRHCLEWLCASTATNRLWLDRQGCYSTKRLPSLNACTVECNATIDRRLPARNLFFICMSGRATRPNSQALGLEALAADRLHVRSQFEILLLQHLDQRADHSPQVFGGTS